MDYLLSGLIQAFELLFKGDPETYSAVKTTVLASSLSVAASMVIGSPLGFCLGYARFPGRRSVRVVVDTLLSLPTVVIGLLCYAFMSHRGPLGHLGLLFTIPGMAVGQTILGLPIVVAMTATAVENLDDRLKQTILTLGADPRQLLLTSLWEARFALALAGAAAYGRIVSEVGISMMVGGNIKWHTRTITTAIALETGKGQFAMGIALGLILLALALMVNVAMSGLKRLSE
ncbi:ABC transporter, permease protein [delta proteobacterium NaphS2]|nr:ABC transporter, permease protein [delta proteobacterium NaphS2]